MTMAGIDVSWAQGAYDWGQQAGKLAFAMVKATEGAALTDPTFERNWDALWSLRPDHRLPRFAYCFFHAADDPAAQAEHLVAVVRERGLLPGDNFVLDLEATDGSGIYNDGRYPEATAAAAAAFLHRVNALAPGHRVLVYTSPAFAAAGNTAGLGAWYCWIADYGVASPAVPAPWEHWTFWQSGIRGVDQDVFNGDEDALLAFTRMPDKR
jgi:GH25 family lysozyme M1 (1,4-beta-N-acetylmuramidase)